MYSLSPPLAPHCSRRAKPSVWMAIATSWQSVWLLKVVGVKLLLRPLLLRADSNYLLAKSELDVATGAPSKETVLPV